ncbi:hypothetical protein [Ruminococcus sp.]|uniref:hypothetical protein n=1 Tax=Ruminococcus sp. TaxID=41978 RepID=UPI002E7A6660|nr:hypothetical protein [Ruminococcus sp.]MEE1262335.1 hypothetical protein [Ruminococcus sp.]
MDYIASINDYPSFKDKNDHYCIDLFLSSMDSIDSSNSIYYFISEFRYSLWRLSECTFELSESEKQKYVKVAKELEKRLCEIKESGLFVEIIDGHSKDYYEVKADLKFAAAIMYNKFGNYDKAYKYWWFVIEHMKRFLNTITADDLVTEKSMQIWDFLWLSNEYLYGQVVVPPLYSLIESMRTTFNVTDEADERLYRYYKSLVRAAERAKKEVEKNDDITEFLFDTVPVETEKGDTKLRLFSTKQDYEGLIEKYTKLIEQISGQKYHPQRSFRP